MNLTTLLDANEVEIIRSMAFALCRFSNFRSPPRLVTNFPWGMLQGCGCLFSVELPENIIPIDGHTSAHCHSLKIIVLLANTDVGGYYFDNCTDLLQVFHTGCREVDLMNFQSQAVL
jgi:hypothetical protein